VVAVPPHCTDRQEGARGSQCARVTGLGLTFLGASKLKISVAQIKIKFHIQIDFLLLHHCLYLL
jgi:hypothetical protein